ncbi:MAG: aldehyde dehydrogenase family protein [Myxococcota bacterium]
MTTLTAQQAYDRLDPEKWAQATIPERLHLLEEVRDNLKTYAEELAHADADMKNAKMGEHLYTLGLSMFATAGPLGNAVTASIQLYESLAKGEMLSPIKVTQVREGLFDLQVFPQTAKDKVLSGTQRGHLRVKGEPTQVNPLDKAPGVIAILGAGNYSSSLEMIKALFWENKAVIHKPHHNNDASDRVWEKVLEPLVAYGALCFVPSSEGRALTAVDGLHAIYFTGSTAVAKAIMASTDTPFVAECGGNNPCIVVPGDRPWTDKELAHQALQIATAGKLNGGAVCGRPQTIVTSKHWPQREAFLDALRTAIAETTFANGTYYPGSEKVVAAFREAHPDAEALQPESGAYRAGEFLLITEVDEDAYAVKNEAFCQIFGEVSLDVPAEAEAFLGEAVRFCNETLLGSLGCMLLVDDDTLKANRDAVEEAVTDLNYGGIAVNTIPPLIFANAYLTWGGNEEGDLVSGSGNFGNLLNVENIEKSILYDKFVSPGHLLMTSKEAFEHLMVNFTRYTLEPTWRNLTCLAGTAMIDSLRGKDF